VVIKSMTFVNAREGWQIWEEKLKQLDASAVVLQKGRCCGKLCFYSRTTEEFFS
jgi:hypothetical protein